MWWLSQPVELHSGESAQSAFTGFLPGSAVFTIWNSGFCCLASLPCCWSLWGVGNSVFFPFLLKSVSVGNSVFSPQGVERLRWSRRLSALPRRRRWRLNGSILRSVRRAWMNSWYAIRIVWAVVLQLFSFQYFSYFWNVSLPSALKKSFLRWGEGEGTQLTSLEAVLLSWFWDMGLKMLKRSTVAKLQTVCLELSTLYNPFVLNWVNVQVWSSAVPTRAPKFEGDPEVHVFGAFKI